MNRLDVRETIVAAYKFAFGDFSKIVGRIWLPALLLFAGSYLFMQPYLNFMAGMPDASEVMQHSSLFLGVLFFYFVAVVLYAWMAATVAEEVLTPAENVSYFRYPPVRSVFRVAGGLLAVFVLVLLALTVMEAALGMVSASAPVSIAVSAVVLLAIIYFSVRLAFLLVPAAVAEGNFGVISSWRMTRGRFWRLLAILLATAVPLVLVTLVAQVFVLGPDYFAASAGALGGPDAVARAQSMQIGRLADRFLLAAGVNFFLTPFTYGLYVGTSALAYRALAARTDAPAAPVQES